jgi:hypothetical protein
MFQNMTHETIQEMYHLNNSGREKAIIGWNVHGVLTCREAETSKSKSLFLLGGYRLCVCATW